MTELLETYGAALIFLNVLAEQVGLPVPAMPTMMVSGALVAEGRLSPTSLLAATLTACVFGNVILYVIGRRYGWRVMRLLCSISLSPDSCVQQTSLHFERWGGWTLALGKFIPGINTVAPPLAGVMHMDWGRFLLLSTIGSVFWVAVSVGVGGIFHEQIQEVLDFMGRFGAQALAAVSALVAAYVSIKWRERRRFYESLRMARITVDELRQLLERGREPLVVDLRPAADRVRDGAIPGARAIGFSAIANHLTEFPKDREVVFYCNCPNEASAAVVAKRFVDLGYTRVRPLAGGFDAWASAGYRIEPATA